MKSIYSKSIRLGIIYGILIAFLISTTEAVEGLHCYYSAGYRDPEKCTGSEMCCYMYMTYNPYAENMELYKNTTINQDYYCFSRDVILRAGFSETGGQNVFVKDD